MQHNWERLPREMWVEIIRYVDQRDLISILQVCKSLCAAAFLTFNPSIGSNLLIRDASEFGLVGVVTVLMTDGRVDPATMKNKPMALACKNGHIPVIKQLSKDKRVYISEEAYSLLQKKLVKHPTN